MSTKPDDIPTQVPEKPGKVLAVGIMMLIGGILAIFLALGFAASCILLVWPGTYYSLVFGIVAIVKGAKVLGGTAHLEPAPRGTAICQIINIINGDFANLVMGIIELIFLNEPESRDYFRG